MKGVWSKLWCGALAVAILLVFVMCIVDIMQHVLPSRAENIITRIIILLSYKGREIGGAQMKGAFHLHFGYFQQFHRLSSLD